MSLSFLAPHLTFAKVHVALLNTRNSHVTMSNLGVKSHTPVVQGVCHCGRAHVLTVYHGLTVRGTLCSSWSCWVMYCFYCSLGLITKPGNVVLYAC